MLSKCYYYYVVSVNFHCFLLLRFIAYFLDRKADAEVYATTPINRTVASGTTVKFGCETHTESKIRWDFSSPQLQLPQSLFTGHHVVSSVAWRTFVNATGRWNEITVANVSGNDSGEYTCYEREKISMKVIFHLNVEGPYIFRIASLY